MSLSRPLDRLPDARPSRRPRSPRERTTRKIRACAPMMAVAGEKIMECARETFETGRASAIVRPASKIGNASSHRISPRLCCRFHWPKVRATGPQRLPVAPPLCSPVSPGSTGGAPPSARPALPVAPVAGARRPSTPAATGPALLSSLLAPKSRQPCPRAADKSGVRPNGDGQEADMRARPSNRSAGARLNHPSPRAERGCHVACSSL